MFVSNFIGDFGKVRQLRHWRKAQQVLDIGSDVNRGSTLWAMTATAAPRKIKLRRSTRALRMTLESAEYQGITAAAAS